MTIQQLVIALLQYPGDWEVELRCEGDGPTHTLGLLQEKSNLTKNPKDKETLVISLD